AAGAVGADELRPVEHLGLVEHAEKLGGVGDGDGLGVAAEPAQPGTRAFEDGAHLGDDAVAPRQPVQARQEDPVIKSEGDDGEDETYQHVIDSLRFEFARELGSLPSPPRTRACPSSALLDWPKSGKPDFGWRGVGGEGPSADHRTTPTPSQACAGCAS